MPQLTESSLKSRLKKSLVPSLMAVLVVFSPVMAVHAAQPAGQTKQEVKTGPCAAADPYVLNANGMYENSKCIWNPNTGITTIKDSQDYSYNPETDCWDTQEWQCNKETGYTPNTPAPAPQPSSETEQQPDDGTTTSLSPQRTSNQTEPLSADATSVSGPGSSSETELSDRTKAQLENYYNAEISNNITSDAISGDATVSGNTSAGDATTGDATAIANLINMLQSTWNWGAGLVTTFVADIYGDVFGDITVDPDKITGPDSETDVNANRELDIDVNSEENATINNDVDVSATSGDATVQGNTSGGDATTGDATAIANIINLISSSISADESFMGMINIHGNYNGDILLPQGVIDQLLAANNSSTTVVEDIDIDVDTEGNQTINNEVTGNAGTGNATVANNTAAGDATSGDASNQLTILNLTGRQVSAENSLLVFVNVFGQWVGLIMDAPKGTTAAALGGGVDVNKTLDVDADINLESNQTINNDVDLSATSGDATVTQNTSAGSATSGDANTAANVANITDSTFALDNWFGVLFINVFGSWTGSFGVDTSAGELPEENTGNNGAPALPGNVRGDKNKKQQTTASPQLASAATSPTAAAAGSVFGYVYSPAASTTSTTTEKRTLPSTISLTTSNDSSSGDSGSVAGASDPRLAEQGWIISAFGVLIGASLIGAERILSARESRRRMNVAA